MAKLTIESTVKELLENEKVKAKVEELIPGVTSNPMVALVKSKPFKDIVDMLYTVTDGTTIEKFIVFLKELDEE